MGPKTNEKQNQQNQEDTMQVSGVRLPRLVYEEVARMAAENDRTIVGQVAYLVKIAVARITQDKAAKASQRRPASRED